MTHANRLVVNHLATSPFRSGGLRSHYEYRDLGIREATNGLVGVHVIRVANPHMTSP